MKRKSNRYWKNSSSTWRRAKGSFHMKKFIKTLPSSKDKKSPKNKRITHSKECSSYKQLALNSYWTTMQNDFIFINYQKIYASSSTAPHIPIEKFDTLHPLSFISKPFFVTFLSLFGRCPSQNLSGSLHIWMDSCAGMLKNLNRWITGIETH